MNTFPAAIFRDKFQKYSPFFFLFCMVLLSFLPRISFGANFATSTTIGGNWSATSTWAGGVVPGDGYFVDIVGPVTIDQNIGSVGGGGIKTISLTVPASSLSVNNSAPRTILFASTGTDPVGSGSDTAPGTDATMFGFFMDGTNYQAFTGTLSLIGTQANPVTIEAANGTSPIYISNPQEFPADNSANITLKYVDAYNLGTSGTPGSASPDFSGIVTFNQVSTVQTVDIEHCRFTSPYEVLTVQNSTYTNSQVTFSNNYITGSRGIFTIKFLGNFGTTTIQNNTEVSPAVSGGNFMIDQNGGQYLTFTGNAVMGTSSNTRTLLELGGTSLNGINSINNNLNYNNSTTSATISIDIINVSSSGTTIDSNVGEGSMELLSLNDPAGSSVTVSNNMSISNGIAAPLQGNYILRAGVFSVFNNLALWTSANSGAPELGFFDYKTGSTPTTAVYSHNTFIGASGQNFTFAMSNGESGQLSSNDVDKSNLIYGNSSMNGISTVSGVTFASDFNGVGVHHNDIYGQASSTQAYCTISPDTYCDAAPVTNFQNSGVPHPNSSYGDLNNVNPNFYDTTRTSITNYDSRVLSGPGTVADIFTQLGYRSTWGGTYTLSATPVNDIRTWLNTGYSPTNAALRTAAADSTAIGAVTFIDNTAPTVGITNPTNLGTVSGTITLTATSTDDVVVAGVQFQIDGVNFGSEVTSTSSPNTYTLSWNTTGATNASHTIGAIAYDTSGNTATTTISVTVNNLSAPGAPTGVSAIAGNATSTVTFSAPGSNGGSAITGYTVYSSNGGIDTNAGSTTLSHLITGLTNGTAYTFAVTATNAIGTSTLSASSTPVTPATIPSAPTIGTATPGNAQASVTFTAGSNGGSAITQYAVTSSPGNITTYGGSSPITVTGLTNGTPYTFTAVAVNTIGTSTPSAATSPAVTPSLPSATTFTFTNGGSSSGNAGSATPTFTITPNGLYTGTITITPSGSASTGLSPVIFTYTSSSAATTTTFTPTTAGTLTLVPTNNSGGSVTNPSNLTYTVNAVVPGVPTSPSGTPGNASASISFTAPTNTGGSPILYYSVGSNVGNFFATSTVSPVTVNGLTNGQAYIFTVTATNIAGTSASSTATSAVIPVAGAPGSPTSVSASAGNATSTVTFLAPGSNGGSTITAYIVTSNPAGGTDTNANTTSLTHLITGLTNGTAYTFAVTASNAFATSSASTPSTPVIPATIPSIPTGVSGIPGNASVSVSFTAPANNGSAITQYAVTSSPDNITAYGASSPITVSGLTNTTPYTFTVVAVNAIGTSTPSSPSTAVTPSNAVPGAPTAVSATVSDSQAQVSFTAPAFIGGSAITGYTVTSSPGGITASSASSPINITNLSDGTAYTFTVTATNTQGVSLASLPSAPVTPIAAGSGIQSGGGGGGSGGNGPLSIALPESISVPVVTGGSSSSVSSLQSELASLLQTLSTLITQAQAAGISVSPAITAAAGGTSSAGTALQYDFTHTLVLWNIDPDVIKLQQFLNSQGFTVAKTGNGSPGHETDIFGPATQAALIKFQKAHHISPAAGYFGVVTRGVVDSL